MMMMSLLPLCCILLFVFVGVTVGQTPSDFYTKLRSQDASIFAASMIVQNPSQVVYANTWGTSNYVKGSPMWDSSAFRINSLPELFVAISLLKLVDLSVLTSVNDPIPSKYLPRGVSNFFNPNFPSVGITPAMLLFHTSSISDSKFIAGNRKLSPNPVVEFKAFVESYFLVQTVSGGTTSYTTAQDIWLNTRPGDANSYSYARANIALAGHIVEQAILERPNLVSSATKNLASFIQEQIIYGVGMGSTFLKTLTGDPAGVNYPNAMHFGNNIISDVTATGTDQAQSYIHPAYVAASMYFSSSVDIAKFVRSLFVAGAATGGILQPYAARLRSPSIDLPAGRTMVNNAQKKAGLGLMFFDGAAMCSIAIGSGVISSCPLTSSMFLWGHVSVSEQDMVGFFCTDFNNPGTSTCVNAHLSFSYFESGDSGATVKSTDYLLGFAAVAFQTFLPAGSTSTPGGTLSPGSGSSGSTRTTSTSTSADGAYIFLGVFGTLVFVITASYFTEQLIQPAPLPAPLPVPTGDASLAPEFQGDNTGAHQPQLQFSFN